MREFNVLGTCIPDMHYMVDTSKKIDQIIEMVDKRKYFTINRARQYGKTTTLGLLKKALVGEYFVAKISFEGLDDGSFSTPQAFCHMFMEQIRDALHDDDWFDVGVVNFQMLGKHIRKMCQDKKIVVMIDEVDKASNNRVFLYFLGMLRKKFLLRNEGEDITFHSVILAGVYDIKNIKLKMVTEGIIALGDKEAGENSPWNIAANFKVDMSFLPADIATMLRQYESDYNTGMDIELIAQEIYNYTGGYPFLVSRICQCIEEDLLTKDWTVDGVQKAVKIIVKEKNLLFDDIYKNMINYKEIYDLLYDILITGKTRTFSHGSRPIEFAMMFGIIKETENGIGIANRIFENIICNAFIANDEQHNSDRQITDVLKEDVAYNGTFDMALCIKKFAKHYYMMFADRDLEFYERHGRLLFLSYLQPLINGIGFYHIESETRNARRMDIIVDYGRQQFIIELKLWSGDASHDKAYEQLLGYMDSKGAKEGYLLTFDFRTNVNKEQKAEWVNVDEKRIFDVVV